MARRTHPTGVSLRRTIELLSVTLVLAGLELAAGTLSTTLDRFTQTLSDTFSADVLSFPPARFVAGAGMIVAGVGGLLLAVWVQHTGARLSRGTVCGRCGGQTQRMRRAMRHHALGAVLGRQLLRQRCIECGWKGLSARD